MVARITGLLAAVVLVRAASTEGEFQQFVAPLLASQCSACHSGKLNTSGFSVASVESIIAGGNKHGKAVIGGHPEQSPLIRILKGELQPRMPVGKTLDQADIARIEDWIRSLPADLPADKGAARSEWRWPFEKPVKGVPPAVQNAAWAANAIDAFILARLEQDGLKPAPSASKPTLARRVYYDLIGLPPTPEEMSAFLADESPRAYEKLIDKLLADPRYGERWGRHWLDLARYGETSGLEGDGAIGNAWRYRDWVIDAFNHNMPYDRFVILQIGGGDEQSKTRNNYRPDEQGLIPTAFLRLAPWDRSNLVAADVRQNYLNEVTTVTSSVFLGLTLGCARCHDHKYDPIPSRDFYRFQAFFNAIDADRGAAVPFKDKAMAARAEMKARESQDQAANGPEARELAAYEAGMLQKLIAGRKAAAQGLEYTKEDLRLELRYGAAARAPAGGAPSPAAPGDAEPFKSKPTAMGQPRIFTPDDRQQHADLLEAAQRTGDIEEEEQLKACEVVLMQKLRAGYAKGDIDPSQRFQSLTIEDLRTHLTAKYAGKSIFTTAELDRQAELTSKVDVLRRRAGRWSTSVLAVSNVAGPPAGPDLAPTRVLKRGDYRQPGEAVEAGYPSAITGNSGPAVLDVDRYLQFPTRGRRITLAKWMAGRDNPLTARVMVNRMWQHHFGEGIVRTTSDFGKNGDRPSHSELLDYLAVRFMEEGWNIKAMHKLMLLSRTYQQASENPTYAGNTQDPDNRLLWRCNRRRLEAEAIRDSILYVSGRLNPEMGGPSVFPPLPDDLADFARYGRTGGVMWEPNEKDEDARRRSVYIFQRRSLPLPMMAAFDATVFSESCERRSSTTTPLQALSMMNGALVHEESGFLARRIVKEAGDDRRAQVSRAFEIMFSRQPKPDEMAAFLKFASPLDALCRVLMNSNEFLYTE
jgi:hypothetical protein